MKGFEALFTEQKETERMEKHPRLWRVRVRERSKIRSMMSRRRRRTKGKVERKNLRRITKGTARKGLGEL